MAIDGYFDDAAMIALAQRGNHTVDVVANGVLQAPEFGRGPRWIAGTVLRRLTATGIEPGWIETRLLEDAAPDDAVAARCQALVQHILAERIGGTFWAGDPVARIGALPANGLTVLLPGRDPVLADAMLADALAREDASKIMLQVDGPGSSHKLTSVARRAEALGCHVVHGPVDPWKLLDRAAIVHCAGNDPVALLALITDVKLRCHGAGVFAGWGLSDDTAPQTRAGQRGIADLARAALIDGVCYANPFHANRTTPEDIVEILTDWRRHCDAARGMACLVGISFWKRQAISALLHDGASPPRYRRGTQSAVALAHRTGRAVAVWPSRAPPDLAGAAQAEGVAVWNIEDGFVRSVGLGSDSMPPCSVILDRTGIYFDPRRPSDLETLLQRTNFPPALLARAARLRERLVALRISKYNVGGGAIGFTAPPGKRRILVPGQVSDDLSMLQGGAGMQGNLQLLQRARAANRDAFVIYKPHPDVDAGHRKGAIPQAEALHLADVIVRGVAMPTLLDAVDEVHTITSLTGFEALLRGLKVVAYGQPFYAGWGLTEDRTPPRRRTRVLSLDELVAGALILYPRYLDPLTGLPCPPEVLIERMTQAHLWRPGLRIRARSFYGVLRKRLFGRG